MVKEVKKKREREREKRSSVKEFAAEFSTPFRNPYVPLQLFNLFRWSWRNWLEEIHRLFNAVSRSRPCHSTSLSGSFITGQRHFQEKNPSNDATSKYLDETFSWIIRCCFYFIIYSLTCDFWIIFLRRKFLFEKMMNLAKISNKIFYQKFIIKISIAVLIGKKRKTGCRIKFQ